jgi:hypothetical protein
MGVLLWLHAGKARLRPWHVCGLAIHVLLGGANVAFWPSFAAFGLLGMGIATTAMHALFVVAHGLFLLRASEHQGRRAAPRPPLSSAAPCPARSAARP